MLQELLKDSNKNKMTILVSGAQSIRQWEFKTKHGTKTIFLIGEFHEITTDTTDKGILILNWLKNRLANDKNSIFLLETGVDTNESSEHDKLMRYAKNIGRSNQVFPIDAREEVLSNDILNKLYYDKEHPNLKILEKYMIKLEKRLHKILHFKSFQPKNFRLTDYNLKFLNNEVKLLKERIDITRNFIDQKEDEAIRKNTELTKKTWNVIIGLVQNLYVSIVDLYALEFIVDSSNIKPIFILVGDLHADNISDMLYHNKYAKLISQQYGIKKRCCSMPTFDQNDLNINDEEIIL